MQARRAPGISVAVVVLAVAVGVLCVVACVSAFGTPYDQCDNMAGTCIRERQQFAIVGLRTLCVAGVVVSVGVALSWWRWPRLGRWVAAGALVLAAAIAVFVLAADPIDHLNNRWSGWLGV